MKKTFKKWIVSILTAEAKLVLKKYKPKIVAVTGSVGKTSTKDAIYTVMAASFHVRKSDKSFNSEIGVPLTILGLPNAWSNPFLWALNIIEGIALIIFPNKYPEWLVLEVGADRPGDIRRVAKWLKPDVAVMTRFGDVPVHVEYFPSIEDLVTEKGYLARSLKPNGTLIVNGDDKRIMAFADTILHRKITYGFSLGVDVQGSHDAIQYGPAGQNSFEFPTGMTFRVDHSGSSIPVSIDGSLGHQHIYPVLAALSVGISQNLNIITMSEALKSHELPKGRMRLIDGIKDTLLIDDTYNSSPVAVQEALKTLSAIKAPDRKIAILGDMMELGEYSIEEHRKVGVEAAKIVDLLITVGIRSRATADAALDAGLDESKVLQFDESTEAGKFILENLQVADIMLVKGSQSMRMERIVAELMVHAEHKEDYLVRQDKEWQAID